MPSTYSAWYCISRPALQLQQRFYFQSESQSEVSNHAGRPYGSQNAARQECSLLIEALPEIDLDRIAVRGFSNEFVRVVDTKTTERSSIEPIYCARRLVVHFQRVARLIHAENVLMAVSLALNLYNSTQDFVFSVAAWCVASVLGRSTPCSLAWSQAHSVAR